MAAKGAVSKQNVANQIMSTFAGAFIAADGKTIRIPLVEDGEPIEIKVTLVAAKDLESNGTVATAEVAEAAPAATDNIEITEAEKKRVNDLLNSLNF